MGCRPLVDITCSRNVYPDTNTDTELIKSQLELEKVTKHDNTYCIMHCDISFLFLANFSMTSITF